MKIVFSVDNNTDEPNYEKMAVLLAKSIKDTNPKAEMYCGVFGEHISTDTDQQLRRLGVHVVYDTIKTNSELNYFLRNYTMHFFSQRFDEFIYLDIDVLVLGDLSPILEHEIIVEQVPDYIVEKEKPYIGSINHALYYNWVQVVNQQNKYLYDIDYSQNMYLKESDILISKRIINSDLKIHHQDFGAYYPKHELNTKSILFHYDSFIDSGTFYKLEEFNPTIYKKYKLYAELILGIEINNNKEYWNEQAT